MFSVRRIAAAMLAYAPFMILGAPHESTMGARAEDLLLSRAVVVRDVHLDSRPRRGRPRVLFTRDRRADAIAVAAAELAAIFGPIGLVTGPLWARKAWGVW